MTPRDSFGSQRHTDLNSEASVTLTSYQNAELNLFFLVILCVCVPVCEYFHVLYVSFVRMNVERGLNPIAIKVST